MNKLSILLILAIVFSSMADTMSDVYAESERQERDGKVASVVFISCISIGWIIGMIIHKRNTEK